MFFFKCLLMMFVIYSSKISQQTFCSECESERSIFLLSFSLASFSLAQKVKVSFDGGVARVDLESTLILNDSLSHAL